MVAELVARARSLWRGARRRADVEREMAEEFRLHLELRAADLVRQGLTPAAARRQARLDFGCAELHKDAAREARGLGPLDGLRVSWLDFKLGLRMLVKYPGLTVVGGLAMAFAIWVGAVTFELASMSIWPTLPLAEGDRVVQLVQRDVATRGAEQRVLHDFVAWREALQSVTELGAARDVTRNLITADRVAMPVHAAEITASAFRLARVAPRLGRALIDGDERPDAPPVVVIGHELWRTRFASDPAAVGRSVRLGDAYATVVGVMPEGFEFPESHELWTALRLNPLDYSRRAGPELRVFGRLAPGVTLEAAQAELTTLGQRAAAESPDTHRHLRPRVAPYAALFLQLNAGELAALLSINVFVVMLLVLVCGNVALLLFARAATREGELAVRAALGAGRGRIVAQLFAEALVLGGVAAALGLVAAGLGLRWGLWGLEQNLGRLPFWFDDRLSPTTILYAVGLTLLGAVVAGVVPALKVTRGLGARLKQATAGAGGLEFGGVWTAVIVTQVAMTVAFPALTFVVQREMARIRSFDHGFTSHEYLSMRIDMDEETVRRAPAVEELRRRVAAEGGVSGVTFVDRLPRTFHPTRRIEVDDPSAATGRDSSRGAQRPAHYVAVVSADPSYFDVLEAPVLSGRGFQAVDLAPEARVVLVNQSFVERVLRSRNPVGQRVRFTGPEEREGRPAAEPRPWSEIVGVVKDLGTTSEFGEERSPGLYLPAAPGRLASLRMVVHVPGDPESLGPRVRALAAAVDPTLRVSDIQPMDDVANAVVQFIGIWRRVTVLLSAVALLLSLAGIYAVMSFTVARRTREIGIRVALGSDARRVVAAIFRRPLTHVALGVVAGGAVIATTAVAVSGDGLSPGHVALLVAHAAVMLGVCLLACIVPTRRALRVQPTEALRAEG